MAIPTLAAPVDATAYRRYFQKLAEEVLTLSDAARRRVRIWNYWRTGSPDGTWTFFLPYVSLTRDGSTCPAFRYRLCFAAFCWGIDIGLVAPKRVVTCAAHEGVSQACVNRGEKVNVPETTDAYDADEANERP
jgi:hypothetical protein